MNHPAGSYLLAISAIACTGLSVELDPRRDAPEDPVIQPAERDGARAAATSLAGVPARSIGRTGALVAREVQAHDRAFDVDRALLEARRDPGVAAFSQGNLPPHEQHLEILDELGWPGGQAP